MMNMEKKPDVLRLANQPTVESICSLASDPSSPFWSREISDGGSPSDNDLILAHEISMTVANMVGKIADPNDVPWRAVLNGFVGLCRRIDGSGEKPDTIVKILEPITQTIKDNERWLNGNEKMVGSDTKEFLKDTLRDYLTGYSTEVEDNLLG